jgi:hypothetical protein
MSEFNSPKGFPDSGYRIKIENVWQQVTPEIKQEVIRFWSSEGASLNEEVAAERANQLVLLARDPEGNIIGVCTAYITYISNLANHLFYYRSLIARKYRQHGLAKNLLIEAGKFFNRLFQEGKETKAIGIFLEIENQELKKYNQAVWTDGGAINFYFIGSNNEGSYIRVFYFENTFIY